MTSVENLSELAARIPDGARIGLPPEYSFVPMGMIFSLIRQDIKNLDVICVPIGGLAVDLLIGSGCVRSLEAAAVSLGEMGKAPQFTIALQEGRIEFKDSTCPAIHTALQASEKGVPFMPLGGLIGSDLLNYRKDWRVIEDPLEEENGRIVLIPAIQPDFAILHSPLADSQGNVWIGKRRELITLAHAAKETLVTVEAIVEHDFLADEKMSAGTLSNLYISAISKVHNGSKPLSLPGHYDSDSKVIEFYASEARTDVGFRKFVNLKIYKFGIIKIR